MSDLFNEYGVLRDENLKGLVEWLGGQVRDTFEVAKQAGATPLELRALADVLTQAVQNEAAVARLLLANELRKVKQPCSPNAS